MAKNKNFCYSLKEINLKWVQNLFVKLKRLSITYLFYQLKRLLFRLPYRNPNSLCAKHIMSQLLPVRCCSSCCMPCDPACTVSLFRTSSSFMLLSDNLFSYCLLASIQFYLQLRTSSLILSVTDGAIMVLLEMCCCHLILNILLMHLSSFCFLLFVSIQVSHPYRNTDKARLLKSDTFSLLLMTPACQILDSHLN